MRTTRSTLLKRATCRKDGTLFGYIGRAAIVEFTFTPAADATPGKSAESLALDSSRAQTRPRTARTALSNWSLRRPIGRAGRTGRTEDGSDPRPPSRRPHVHSPRHRKGRDRIRPADSPIGLDRITAINNFDIRIFPQPLANGATFTPVRPAQQLCAAAVWVFSAMRQSLYLGFDRKLRQWLHQPADRVIGAQRQRPGCCRRPAIRMSSGNIGQRRRLWKPLDIQDGTAILTSTGIIGFMASTTPSPRVVFPQLTDDRPSIGIALACKSGTYATPPQLKAVLINTWRRQPADGPRRLGAGLRIRRTGPARHHPAAAGAGRGHLGSRERTAERAPSATRSVARADGAGDRAARARPSRLRPTSIEEPAAAGGDREIWVRWLRVPNFRSSGPRSRHYTLEAP